MFSSKLIFLQELLDNAVSFLKKNRGAMIGVVGLLVIILIQFVFLPVYNYNKSIDRQEDIVASEYLQIQQLALEYETLKKAASGASGKKKDINLFARLENLTRQLRISSRVDFMRPSSKTLDDGRVEEEVYIRFKSMIQKNFINFLYTAEVNGGLVTIKHLRIKKNKNRRFDIDIIFTRIDG